MINKDSVTKVMLRLQDLIKAAEMINSGVIASLWLSEAKLVYAVMNEYLSGGKENECETENNKGTVL